MLQLTVHFLLCHWSLISWLLLNVYLLRNRYHHGLNRYPGPLLASLTDWWRFFDVLGRRPDITHIRLHKQHGDVVRLGPNVLSFADPKALKTIYGLNKGFIKVYDYSDIPRNTWNIDWRSPNSTPFSRLSPMERDFAHSSRLRMRTITPPYAEP